MSPNPACPSCHQSIPEESQFCPFCGHSFTESIPEEGFPVNPPSEAGECPNCGTIYELPMSVYCGSCGYALSQPEAISEPVKEISEPFLPHLPPPVFKDDANNVPVQIIRDASKSNEEPSSTQNIYFTTAAVVGVLILLGMVLVGGALILKPNSETKQASVPTLDINVMYTSAMQTAQDAITQTAIYVPTSTPTPIPTSTPTLMPSLTPTYASILLESNNPQKEVEDFIYSYWGLIDRKDFSTAWLYQSPRFRNEVNQDNFDGFANGFQYTKNVVIIWAKTISVSEYDAIIDADLQFIAIDGTIINASHRYTLVKQNNQWLIDTAAKR